ncbi:starch synthase, partial [bacterium]|nr:starch synthase [bacterium]
MAASEAYPYSKSGGLADVMGTMPGYLGKMNNEVSLVLPLYASTRRKFFKKMVKEK